MHKMSYYLYFFCKILIGIVYTLDLCQMQPQNVLVDEKGLRILLEIVEIRNVFASITKGPLANFSNTILGDVSEPETLKNDLNQGGLVGGRIQLLQETISISLQSLKVIEWD